MHLCPELQSIRCLLNYCDKHQYDVSYLIIELLGLEFVFKLLLGLDLGYCFSLYVRSIASKRETS